MSGSKPASNPAPVPPSLQRTQIHLSQAERQGLQVLAQRSGRSQSALIHDAKTHLSRYVDQALAGEDVVIARSGKPVVRLVPLAAAVGPRRGGFLRGKAIISADL